MQNPRCSEVRVKYYSGQQRYAKVRSISLILARLFGLQLFAAKQLQKDLRTSAILLRLASSLMEKRRLASVRLRTAAAMTALPAPPPTRTRQARDQTTSKDAQDEYYGCSALLLTYTCTQLTLWRRRLMHLLYWC